jgi:hypothetical protein
VSVIVPSFIGFGGKCRSGVGKLPTGAFILKWFVYGVNDGKALDFGSGPGAQWESLPRVDPAYILGMTLEERLALARKIAARTKPRFVVDTMREEMRQARFAKAKRLTESLARNKMPKR